MSVLGESLPCLKLEALRDGDRRSIFDGAGTHASRNVQYDQLTTMLRQEERDSYRCCDYLQNYPSGFDDDALSQGEKSINEACRTSIAEWMYRVVDHFRVDREVVAIALSYIDRVLSANHCADRRTFKLISSASLHLAMKVHFPNKWKDIGKLIPDLSQGDFAIGDLVGMEMEIVKSLTWLLNPATARCISVHMLSLLEMEIPASVLNKVASAAIFFVELSVCDYSFVTMKKSAISIASLLNATERDIDVHLRIKKALNEIGCRIDWYEISFARERLWALHKQTCLASSRRTSTSFSMPDIPKTEDFPSPRSSHHFPGM
ncbi:cyclin family protein [Skeletonema marinoi]|uniref:Cyclin family protein n=1 Tax=Skeletonema marinoi TaxID=267567 RepID=A0AAD8Y9P7_9STRA|nr:cyclin family protein [Skeletonema marinoi]|mmetsp:Transcript_3936/g.8337  ORF Transcript_3936/g.8337 Transcript_3936/m.8337 type:complete len:319 (-) Transcript_3936:123-1079(-)